MSERRTPLISNANDSVYNHFHDNVSSILEIYHWGVFFWVIPCFLVYFPGTRKISVNQIYNEEVNGVIYYKKSQLQIYVSFSSAPKGLTMNHFKR